jgi:tRNA(fMet)-specific endonuclease VapC
LDTNIIAYLLKGHSLAAPYMVYLRGHTLAVSFMTVAELCEWGLTAHWGPGRFARMEMTLRNYLVIPSSPELCRQWGQVRMERRSQPIGVADAWIAATALLYRCELVTHNPSDFQGINGLAIITQVP